MLKRDKVEIKVKVKKPFCLNSYLNLSINLSILGSVR
jgi:hypothetical protein